MKLVDRVSLCYSSQKEECRLAVMASLIRALSEGESGDEEPEVEAVP